MLVIICLLRCALTTCELIYPASGLTGSGDEDSFNIFFFVHLCCQQRLGGVILDFVTTISTNLVNADQAVLITKYISGHEDFFYISPECL